MNEIKYLLTEVDIPTFLLVFFILIAAIQWILEKWDKMRERFGWENKNSLKKKEESTRITTYGVKIADLDEKFNVLSDKFDSFCVSSENMDKTINEKINILSRMMLESQEKADAAARARLKDKIGERYREYHEAGEWNNMEKEAFEDLIEDYEAHGGKNSFVHDICQVECHTWKLID